MKRTCWILTILLAVVLAVPAMAAGNGETTYRALLIGVDAYQPVALEGCVNDVNRMSQALQAANDAGAFYQSPVIRSNLETSEIQALENDLATWNVDEDDVTFFYFSGRGYLSDKGTPAIVGKDSKMFSIADLIGLLDGIKGTKMVALDMRYEDDMLLKSGETQIDPAEAQSKIVSFDQSVLDAFRQSPNASNYYVLAATTLSSSEVRALPAGEEPRGIVTYLLTAGCGYDYVGQRPTDQLLADSNGNGAVSLTEARDYITYEISNLENADELAVDVAISPEGSTYPLLARRATSEVLEVVLSQDSIEVPMGRTRQLEAETQPPNASKRTISWSSSDLSIASVDDDGIVTGIKPGIARIAATTANGLTVFADVTVRDVTLVENLTLSASKLTVGNNSTVQMNLTVEPSDASENILWSTGNSGIATVDQNGLVSCHSNGETYITVASESGIEATCNLSVVEPKGVVTSVLVNQSKVDMYVGETVVMQSKVKPADATDPTVTFTSSDPAVATISGDSIINAEAPGECTVYATASSGIYAPVAVTVKGPELLLSKESVSLKMGGSATLQAKVRPAQDNTEITWESQDPSVATVENGKITPVAEGETTVTATLADGVTSTDCQVSIVGTPVKKIALKPSKLSLEVGAVSDLSCQISPKNASMTGVKWSSGNEEIATVDENGHVTAVAAGRTVLTVSAPSGAKAKCQLIVKPISVTSLSLDQTDLNLVAGVKTLGQCALTAVTEPAGAGNGSVKWISSNPKVAGVSSSGVVTAKKAGKAVIKAVAQNGSKSISATCNVTVEGNKVQNKTPVTGDESKVYTSARQIQYFRGQLAIELYYVNKTGKTAIVPEEGKLVLTLADGTQYLFKEVKAGSKKLKAGQTGKIDYMVPVSQDDELYGLDLRGAKAELMSPDYEINSLPPAASDTVESNESSGDVLPTEEDEMGDMEYENDDADFDWNGADTEGWAVEDEELTEA